MVGDEHINAIRMPGVTCAALVSGRSSLMRKALLPVASIYGSAIRFRRSLYETGWLSRRRLPCRVVSVGNLTVGGTGKTPVVIGLAEWLHSKGKRVGVLSRGYRRTSPHEYLLVSDGVRVLTGPSDAGDEPYLIASRCSGVVVAVGADRYRLGEWVLKRFPLDYLLLDDGYQHLALHRDVDLLLVDASDAVGMSALLPAGRLREPICAATRADAVLVTRFGADRDSESVLSKLRAVKLKSPPYPVRFIPECLVHVKVGNTSTVDDLRGRRGIAVSGVGNPNSFRLLLQNLGVQVQDELRFPDHHAYTYEDVGRMQASAARHGADLILTTEKDAGKLKPFVSDQDPVWAIRLQTEMIERGEELERLVLGEK